VPVWSRTRHRSDLFAEATTAIPFWIAWRTLFSNAGKHGVVPPPGTWHCWFCTSTILQKWLVLKMDRRPEFAAFAIIQSSAQQSHKMLDCVSAPLFESQLIVLSGIIVAFFATPFVLPATMEATAVSWPGP